ncbi:MAG: Sua5 YciO YrdC YwlC family protein [Sulfurovum sp.]|nr:Sua5 YciO YrdC YwlC family protein [Sulfurovum sp.]
MREKLKQYIFLTQTDTIVGFISQNSTKLTQIKQRPPHKHYIRAVNSLHLLKSFTRVPKIHKKRLRHSQKTTFIMPNTCSFRVVKDSHHLLLLNRIDWAYTTSANLSGNTYDENFSKDATDIIVEPLHNECTPSRIIKLGKYSLKKIR